MHTHDLSELDDEPTTAADNDAIDTDKQHASGETVAVAVQDVETEPEAPTAATEAPAETETAVAELVESPVAADWPAEAQAQTTELTLPESMAAADPEAAPVEASAVGEVSPEPIEATPAEESIDVVAETATDEPAVISAAETESVEASVAVADAETADPTPAATESEQAEAHGEAKQVHDSASDAKLIAEVAAAPHKVYLLNRVRKALTAAGETERAAPLKAVEEQILAEIETRKTAKEALCARAEEIKDSTSWRVTGDAFKALFDEWKQIGATGRELDDQLWARFNAARGAFNERRSKHFEEREVVWSANREQKEALCAEAEALSESTAWKQTADAIRDLQTRWKAVGSAGREKDEALWARFNTAKQKFFDHRGSVWEENRKKKEALVIDAETLKDSADWRTAGDAMKAMQAEWKNIGPAGREHEDELWGRFRAATQAFFDRRSSVFAERNQTERDNAAQKVELCVRAEALLYAGDPLSAAREAKELQAQWKEIGPVPREQSEPLWARFRGACDKIFENASGERDRQQNEWHVRMREAMTRKREQLASLRESIAHDEANILRWRESLSSLKPGGKSDEIGKSLEDKIIDVMGRIREKQERAEDLRSSITDIEAKLRE